MEIGVTNNEKKTDFLQGNNNYKTHSAAHLLYTDKIQPAPENILSFSTSIHAKHASMYDS